MMREVATNLARLLTGWFDPARAPCARCAGDHCIYRDPHGNEFNLDNLPSLAPVLDLEFTQHPCPDCNPGGALDCLPPDFPACDADGNPLN